MAPLPSLVFDLDGTLVDTAGDLLRVTQEVTAPLGVKGLSKDKLRNLVGYGARFLITQALTDSCIIVDDKIIDERVQLFLDLYGQDIARISRPFDGVTETLASLKREGYDLSVATNKPGYLARQLLGALEMTPYFSAIIGGGDVKEKKPAAGHIFAACQHRGSRPIVVIGDSLPDVGAARAAKAKAIIMAYGYSPQPPESLRADVVLTSFRQLPSTLEIV